MKTTMPFLGGAALCAAIVSPQLASANLLINGGLEVTAGQIAATPSMVYPDTMIHASQVTNAHALTGWTIGGACIDIIPKTYWQNTQGNYSVDLIGTSGIGSISQKVTGLTAGTAYVLTFDFAINPESLTNEQLSTKLLQVTATNSTLSPTIFSGTAGTRTKTNMEYIQEVVDFTATDTNVTLGFAALMPTGLSSSFRPDNVFCGPVIDNLDLEPSFGDVAPPLTPNTPPPLPEPASVGVLGIGGLMLLRRRKAK